MSFMKYFLTTLILFAPLITSRSLQKGKSEQYFLNGKVIPKHYDIHLNTHVEDCEKGCSYEGKTKITITVNKKLVEKGEKINNIQLNIGPDIRIGLCKLSDSRDRDIPVKFSINNETEIIEITSSDGLSADEEYFLYFEYSSTHNDGMYGFYRSSYKTPEGNKRWILTTQFQPNDARDAYPCFDEPKYKATFEMAITLSQKAAYDGYHVLFNTNLNKKTESQNDITYKFVKTPYPLSTYLIAFIVSDFHGTDVLRFESDYGSEKKVQKEFRTWGEKKYVVSGDAVFPQLVGATAIKELSDYLGIGYAYPKMDQVGVPDFAAGAMENWGLVTYRERLLFYNKETVSESVKKAIVNVISHELAHQWFGDLVTLMSWDYIWLNEGFATYFAALIADKVAVTALNATSWNTMGQMVIEETQVRALEVDALEHSRPLSVKIINPRIVASYFDSISYAKGASILRMWSHALGEEVFRKGLNIYLNTMKEQNSIPRDLLKSFEKVCNETECIDSEKFGLVTDLFEEWHSTWGYPVVTVKKENKTTYKISQDQFLWFHHKNESFTSRNFSVPITYSVASKPKFDDTKPSLWLKKNGLPGVISLQQEEKWIILNNQHTGYYRINYDKENWAALIEQLNKNHLEIHEINRAQLINDIFSFGRSTYKDYNVGYETAFNLAVYLQHEEDLVPWKAALNSFSYLDNKLSSSTNYTNFRQFLVHLMKRQYDKLGLSIQDEKAHLQNLLRMEVGDWACSLNYKPCVEDALGLYKNPSAISADVKKIVYCTAVREGGDEVWDNVWNLYLNSPDNVEQAMFLSTLGCSNSPRKLTELLTKTIIKNSGIRKQDYASTFASVYKAGNVQAALEFLVTKFEDIAASYSGIDPLGPLLIGISAKLNTETDLKTMKNLQEKINKSYIENVRVAEVSMGKAIEIVESNINWINIKRESIENWLVNNTFRFADMLPINNFIN